MENTPKESGKQPGEQAPADTRLQLGVEGDGVTPESFDVVATLEFVSAFVAAMRAVADAAELELELHSLQIVPGSAVFAMESANRAVAEEMMSRTRLYIISDAEPPHAAKGPVTELCKALERLPSSHRPFLEVNRSREGLPTKFESARLYTEGRPAKLENAELYVEVTNVRGLVIDVGGMKTPRIRLTLEDGRTIAPRASRDLAAKAGMHLYRTVDAVVTLEREGTKVLGTSEIHDFELVEDMAPADEVKRWKRWFADVGGEWEDIEDIEQELGREAPR